MTKKATLGDIKGYINGFSLYLGDEWVNIATGVRGGMNSYMVTDSYMIGGVITIPERLNSFEMAAYITSEKKKHLKVECEHLGFKLVDNAEAN